MSQVERVLLCLAWTLVAGCGGGGGGGGGAPNGNPAPGRQQADLKGGDASTFSEVFRAFSSGEVATLDEAVMGFGGDLPVLTLVNTQKTETCEGGGTVTVTVAGNGADLSLQYQSCVQNGITGNGRMALNFTNINSSARSFDYRLTYTAFSLSSGSRTQTQNGTTTIHTDSINGAHVHQIVLDLTRHDTQGSRTYTADTLTATIRHAPGDYHGIEVTAAGGAIGVSERGFANVSFRPATNDIHLTGGAGSDVFVTLDGDVFGMRYKDAQGRAQEVTIPANCVGLLRVFDDVNAAPIVGLVPNLTLNAGIVHALDLRNYVLDPDFEAVEVAVEIVDGPTGHNLPVTKVGWARYEIAPGDSGVFTVGITATDPSGAHSEGELAVTVNGDSDHDGLLDNYDADDDNDGVADASDPLPFDPTETRDADNDGIGDNADADDDNDGVSDAQDAFPLDPACSSGSDGTGEECFLSAIGGFEALIVEAGILHFVDPSEKVVYRFDPDADAFLAPWQLGTAVPQSSVMTSAAYVPAHNRFYFGYDNGAITAVQPQTGTEQAFAVVPQGVRGLASGGNFLVAQDDSGAWATHYVLAANGTVRSSAEWNYYSRAYAFNPAENRLYFFRDDSSPNDLHYEEIDQAMAGASARAKHRITAPMASSRRSSCRRRAI